MAKKSKLASSIPNRHIYSRVSYLYQAANYLSNASNSVAVATPKNGQKPDSHNGASQGAAIEGQAKQPNRLLNQLRGISRKTRIRLHPELKRSICKCCDAILLPGQTSTSYIQNDSSSGRKGWADVLVIECNACRTKKRFHIGHSRKLKGAGTEKNAKTPSYVDEDKNTNFSHNV